LKRLGGVERKAEAEEASAGGFPDDKINIPVGVTPQNLKNFTLYEMLGFSGEWGASADVEGDFIYIYIYTHTHTTHTHIYIYIYIHSHIYPHILFVVLL
jgi:hypothetical protein